MDKRTLSQLRLERLHVAPRAVELSPAAVQSHFGTVWAPIDDLAAGLNSLPSALARFWLRQSGGHVLVSHLGSRYEPGDGWLKEQQLWNVAYVSASELAAGSLEAWVPLGHLLDHLLGSGGAPAGPWLCEGGGVNPALREVGARLVRLFPLGHGFDAAACRDPRAYFARSLALFLHDRRALNTADPLMEKLLQTTLLADAFWRPPTARHASMRG